MNRTLRRTGTTVGLALYAIWLLAVVAFAVTRFTAGPIPTLINWLVTAGAAVLFIIGLGRIVSRTPQYVAKIRRWLS
ncbi:hypothetical protein [Halococcus thailandensis]|uniref:Uncharacterized protein n=1 Tax=Halococcus thailandensis JCM 13552 TaxID=1227457 RepID=M0N0E8_9EURY|nr:hypothetical protein [Halococcus thailandensis]EMA50554.1 hypothetical protein C451_16345 [Halococcus thailandensis JCM 13552]